MIAVVVIFSIPAVLFLVLTVGMVAIAIADREPSALGYALLMLVVAALPGMLAQGLWRGYRGSRVLAMVVGVLSIPSGILILLLLTTRTAKEWFGLPPATIVHFPKSGPGQPGRGVNTTSRPVTLAAKAVDAHSIERLDRKEGKP
ncbi:hypothetical protein FXF68_09285 [Actinomadura decatromicini]|uniref:Uncharacterized protein n=1 Tax=Actinomadura decatromicini TaxID=2604572 RepID=A0A5D3FR96_9ACTN|nr:hypothetical protein FXF68_09285 [Actinomadura decatromicini]